MPKECSSGNSPNSTTFNGRYHAVFYCPSCNKESSGGVEIRGSTISDSEMIQCQQCKKSLSLASIASSIKSYFRYIAPIEVNPSPNATLINSIAACAAIVILADKRILDTELVKFFEFISQYIEDSSWAAEYSKLRINFFLQEYVEREPSIRLLKTVNTELKISIIKTLFTIALSDGHLDPSERVAIEGISKIINLSSSDFNSISDLYSSKDQTDYEILGISETSDIAEIKRAYRKKSFEFHPDRYQSLPPSFQLFAKSQFQIIHEAYLRLKVRFKDA